MIFNLSNSFDIFVFSELSLLVSEPVKILSIFIFGGEILKGFSLAMILGVVFGTYSSIYIANPVLVFLKVSYKTVVKEDK